MSELARQLRKKQTKTEARLWFFLRNRRMKGMKFRRQHPIENYIVDFYCPKARLAIELDGGGHVEERQRHYDSQRAEFLKSRGVKILRFWDNDVWNNLESVLKKIWRSLPENTPHPALSPKGRGK